MEPANLHEFFTGFSSLLSSSSSHEPQYNFMASSTSDIHVHQDYFNPSPCTTTLDQPWPTARAAMSDDGAYSYYNFNQRSAGNVNEHEVIPASQMSHFLPTKHHDHHHHHQQLFSNENYYSAERSSSSSASNSNSTRYNYFNSNSTSDLCFSSNSLDLNLQAADLLTPNLIRSSLKESPSSSSSKVTNNFCNGGGGRRTNKRVSSSFSESKYAIAEPKTKLRPTVGRSPCPTLKIRKEKLGDRIAALQRLVAPYGKTDTASVLTEAIGYIQFLHDQVQTLSVPYLGSPNIKTSIRLTNPRDEKEHFQAKRDLQSRGLCLVPLSYASCFNSYNNGGT